VKDSGYIVAIILSGQSKVMESVVAVAVCRQCNKRRSINQSVWGGGWDSRIMLKKK